MEKVWLGRSVEEAAHSLTAAGYTVRILPYAGKREQPGASDARVMRCRIEGDIAELVSCEFLTDILLEMEQETIG